MRLDIFLSTEFLESNDHPYISAFILKTLFLSEEKKKILAHPKDVEIWKAGGVGGEGGKHFFKSLSLFSELCLQFSSILPHLFQKLPKKRLSVTYFSVTYFRNVKEWIIYSSSKYKSQVLNKYRNYKICNKRDIIRLAENTQTVLAIALLPALKTARDRSDYIHAGGFYMG